jgi:hypothetical protein
MARYLNQARTGRPSTSSKAFMIGSPVYLEAVWEMAMDEPDRLAGDYVRRVRC